MKAALYLKTCLKKNQIGKPQRVNASVNVLWGFAASSGYEVEGLYHDISEAGMSRTERQMLLEQCDQYDALFLSCAFHLSRTTRQYFALMKELEAKGLEIHSKDHGILSVSNAIPIEKPLRVATYYSHIISDINGHKYSDIQNQVFSLYIKKETPWILVDQYIDKLDEKKVTKQTELLKLIENKDKYDIIIVSDFGNLCWDTSRFFNIRKELAKDIYSLEEGILKFVEEV